MTNDRTTLLNRMNGKPYSHLFLVLAFLIPFLWLCIVRPMALGSGESTSDAYYHMKMAELGPSVFCGKKFPWLTLSVWHDRFADKELLFHFMLWAIQPFQKLFSASGEAPFHVPAMMFIGLALLSFLYAMKRMGVSPPMILTCSILMPLIIPNFLFRFLMMRPHVLSIAYLLLICALLCKGSLRFRILAAGIVSLFYTWSYSNPQFILIPALVFAPVCWKTDSWKCLWIPLAALTGVFFGLLIHPQFPNTFFIWKIQSFDALFGPIFTDSAAKASSEMIPMEMMSPKFSWHLTAFPFYIFTYFTLLGLCRLISYNRLSGVSPAIRATAVLALLFLGGTFLVIRSVEYAVPFMILLGGLVFQEMLREDRFLPLRSKPLRMYLLFTLLAIGCAVYSSVMNIALEKHMVRNASEIGKWARNNLPPETLMVNLDWGDFPAMFHANDKNLYLWGMDPMFSFAYDAKQTKQLETLLLRLTEIPGSDKLLGRLTNAKYAYLLARRENYTELLKRKGWRTVYETEHGAVFLLE